MSVDDTADGVAPRPSRSVPTGPIRSSGIPALVGLAGPQLTPDEIRILRGAGLAGVILFSRNVVDAEQLGELCAAIQDCIDPRQQLPALVAADHEGGAVAALAAAIGDPPSAAALGLADDIALTQAVHTETARRARAVGVNFLLAPVADCDRPGNPVIASRAFGRAPVPVAAHVAAAVSGLRNGGVLTCAKHWPGHGPTQVDSHLGVPSLSLSEAEWEEGDRLPFVAAIEAGVEAVMVGHLVVPALDAQRRIAPLSPPILDRLSLQEGFSGAVLTDALEMAGFADAAPLEALEAGCDVLLASAPATECQELLDSLSVRNEALDRAQRAAIRLRAATGFAHDAGAGVESPSVERLGVERPYDERPYELACRQGIDSPGKTNSAEWRRRAPHWRLIDAAGLDRLLRTPGQGAEILGTDWGPLEQGWGPPTTPPLVLPSPVDDATIHPGQWDAFAAGPTGGGLVVASIRPLNPEQREALSARLKRIQPDWLVSLGPTGIEDLRPPEASFMTIPGVRARDVRLLIALLGGAN